jgi:hypothetical protein
MRAKPWSLKILFYSFIGICLAMPIQVAILYEHQLSELGAILNKLTYLNWAVVGSCFLTALVLRNANKATYPFLLITLAVVAFNNWAVASFGFDYNLEQASYASLAMMTLCGLSLTKKSRLAIMNPNLRWWTTPKRHKLVVDAFIKLPGLGVLKTQTSDISKTGAFVTLADRSMRSLAAELKEGQEVVIDLLMNRSQAVTCTAKVVRKTSTHSNHPIGHGLQFIDKGQGLNRLLKEAVQGP